MKGSEQFKAVIQHHLDNLAERDPLFAETLKKDGKNIDDCITYILNTVQKSGCNGFPDEEIFGMAVHYYDETSIDVGKTIDAGKVVVNHLVELTPNEINEAKQQAIDKIIQEERDKVKTKKIAKKQDQQIVTATLFD